MIRSACSIQSQSFVLFVVFQVRPLQSLTVSGINFSYLFWSLVPGSSFLQANAAQLKVRTSSSWGRVCVFYTSCMNWNKGIIQELTLIFRSNFLRFRQFLHLLIDWENYVSWWRRTAPHVPSISVYSRLLLIVLHGKMATTKVVSKWRCVQKCPPCGRFTLDPHP